MRHEAIFLLLLLVPSHFFSVLVSSSLIEEKGNDTISKEGWAEKGGHVFHLKGFWQNDSFDFFFPR